MASICIELNRVFFVKVALTLFYRLSATSWFVIIKRLQSMFLFKLKKQFSCYFTDFQKRQSDSQACETDAYCPETLFIVQGSW